MILASMKAEKGAKHEEVRFRLSPTVSGAAVAKVTHGFELESLSNNTIQTIPGVFKIRGLLQSFSSSSPRPYFVCREVL